MFRTFPDKTATIRNLQSYLYTNKFSPDKLCARLLNCLIFRGIISLIKFDIRRSVPCHVFTIFPFFSSVQKYFYLIQRKKHCEVFTNFIISYRAFQKRSIHFLQEHNIGFSKKNFLKRFNLFRRHCCVFFAIAICKLNSKSRFMSGTEIHLISVSDLMLYLNFLGVRPYQARASQNLFS